MLRIEVREKGSNQFYREVVNVVSQYRNLIKNPERKLKDNFKFMRDLIFVSAMMLIVMIPVERKKPDTSGITLIVVLVLIIAASGFLLYNMYKILRGYLADQRKSVVTLDEDGVELDKEGSQVVKLAWDSIAFVRVFRESICFVSKDLAGFVVAVTKDYKQEILDYLSENETGVKVISQ